MKLTHNRAVLMMIVVGLLWSTAGVVSRHLESAGRFEVTFWRSAFTALSLLLILPVWRHFERPRGPGQVIERRTTALDSLKFYWGVIPESRAFWISGVCWGVMFTAFMLSLSFTSVAHALVITSIGPLLTALMARFFIGHALPLRTWMAIIAAGGGIVYMYGQQMFTVLTSPEMDSSGLVIGALFAVCVPIAGAINWTVVQRSQTRGERIDLVPSVLLGAILSSLGTLPLAVPFEASSSDMVLLGLLGLTQLAIPCAMSVVCARVLKAPEMSLLVLLEVIFGILWAWLWAHEVPVAEVLLGGSVVIAALVLNEWLGWRNRSAYVEKGSLRPEA